MENKTKFLDKIFNESILDFDNIVKSVIEDLEQLDFPYTYFKKDNKWIIEIEKENDLISIDFDDYEMNIYSSTKKLAASYSNHWQRIFIEFLSKSQKIKYRKTLMEINENTIL